MNQPSEPKEKYLSDYVGTPEQQRKAKSKTIHDFGFAAYEAIVVRSQKGYVRPPLGVPAEEK
jgi:hypothetical protein